MLNLQVFIYATLYINIFICSIRFLYPSFFDRMTYVLIILLPSHLKDVLKYLRYNITIKTYNYFKFLG